MALKNVNGVTGNISLPTGWNGNFAEFDYSFDIPEQVTTGFGSGGFVEADPVGPIRLTGSCSGIAQYDDANGQPFPDALADGSGLAIGDLVASAQGTVTLTFVTGCTLAATCNMTNNSGSRTHSESSMSNSFGSTGAITIVWDETA